MSTLNLTVNGMSCNHCKMTVEKAVAAVKGVVSAVVDLQARKVTIEHNGADIAEIKKAIDNAGYGAED